jgi:flavodoxin
MKNASVIYGTKTQHSRKIAEAIGLALGVEAKNAEDNPPPEESGILYIVGGIYGGSCHPSLTAYAEKLTPALIKKAVLVTSSLSVQHRHQKEIRAVLAKKGIEVMDEMSCTGSLWLIKCGHPSKSEIQTITEAAKAVYLKESSSV